MRYLRGGVSYTNNVRERNHSSWSAFRALRITNPQAGWVPGSLIYRWSKPSLGQLQGNPQPQALRANRRSFSYLRREGPRRRTTIGRVILRRHLVVLCPQEKIGERERAPLAATRVRVHSPRREIKKHLAVSGARGDTCGHGGAKKHYIKCRYEEIPVKPARRPIAGDPDPGGGDYDLRGTTFSNVLRERPSLCVLGLVKRSWFQRGVCFWGSGRNPLTESADP